MIRECCKRGIQLNGIGQAVPLNLQEILQQLLVQPRLLIEQTRNDQGHFFLAYIKAVTDGEQVVRHIIGRLIGIGLNELNFFAIKNSYQELVGPHNHFYHG